MFEQLQGIRKRWGVWPEIAVGALLLVLFLLDLVGRIDTARAIFDRQHPQRLAALNRLRAQNQARVVHGLPKTIGLGAADEAHLLAKAKAGNVTEAWVAESRHFLARAVAFFGVKRALSDISVADVTRWAETLLATPPTGRRRGAMSGGTVRHHLNALSNLYRRAQAEGYVVPGYNPVGAMLEKPTARRDEAQWLEVPDAALLLEAARLHDRTFAYPLVATFLLTGGRESEVLGLEVRDVSTDRKIITFRPNRWRRLKTPAFFPHSAPLAATRGDPGRLFDAATAWAIVIPWLPDGQGSHGH